MSVSVEVPALGESVTEAIIAEWLKSEGDFISEDETLVELETDKITVSVPSPVTGKVIALKASLDDTVEVGDVIAEIEPGEIEESEDGESEDTEDDEQADSSEDTEDGEDSDSSEEKKSESKQASSDSDEVALSPAVKRLVDEHDLDPSKIEATGPSGRLLKGDVLEHIESKGGSKSKKGSKSKAPSGPKADEGALEERVRMSKLRQTVARRLVGAQHEAAMLTTFNEVDMSAVMELRSRYKERFLDKYDTKLGFMSFFVKAAVEALKAFPAVNAEVDEDHIIYKNYYHVGVAVGGGKGLVVPVVRNVDQLSFAEVEAEITRLAKLAMNNKLSLADMQGGTFTISNGGVYGSMLSTPILNPPQVGILGMHNIVERPVAIDGKVEIRPIMYLALSYDHRIVDGKEAVSFLVRLKECVEQPERILLEV